MTSITRKVIGLTRPRGSDSPISQNAGWALYLIQPNSELLVHSLEQIAKLVCELLLLVAELAVHPCACHSFEEIVKQLVTY